MPLRCSRSSRQKCLAQTADRAAALAAAYPDVDRIFTDYARDVHVPGMAWGVIVDGRLVHTGTFGVQDTTTQAPVTPETVFRIASMTKSFTALSILKLRDEGKLALDDLAERYVPELSRHRRIRPATHPHHDSPPVVARGGLPRGQPLGRQQLARTDDEMAALMRQGIPFSTLPGSLRILELRIRDPRSHRGKCLGHAVPRYVRNRSSSPSV